MAQFTFNLNLLPDVGVRVAHVEDDFGRGLVLAAQRQVERGLPSAVHGVHPGSPIQQHLDDVVVAELGGRRQRGLALPAGVKNMRPEGCPELGG